MRNIYLAIIAAFLMLYILPLGFRPLLTPDETRYAEIGRELVAHQDWVVPKLNNLRYFEKPIMGHWLNAISMMLFGENNFAVRFSSAMLTGITALAMLAFLHRYLGARQAVLGTVMFISSALVYAVGTFAVLDSILTCFLTLAMLCFFVAYQEDKFTLQKIVYLSLFGVFCGLAFLTKGFLAVVIPAIAIAPFLFWEKRFKSAVCLSWLPLITLVLTVLPWTLIVHFRDGDFWNYFFWVEHVQRFMEKKESQHPEPFWFFIPVIIVGIFPWIMFLPTIIDGYRGKMKEAFNQPLLRYSACWFILPFLFFSASSGKLATYILPCMPPLAILLSFGLYSAVENGRSGKINLSLKILAVLLGVSAIGLMLLQTLSLTSTIEFTLFGRDEIFKWLLIISAVVIWLCLIFKAIKADSQWRKIIFFTVGMLAAYWAYNLAIPNLVLNVKSPEKMLRANQWRVTPETIIVSYKNLLSSICWYYKRDNLYVYGKGGELSYGLSKPEAAGRFLNNEDLIKLIQQPNRGKILVIVDSPRLWKDLPPGKNSSIINKTLFTEY